MSRFPDASSLRVQLDPQREKALHRACGPHGATNAGHCTEAGRMSCGIHDRAADTRGEAWKVSDHRAESFHAGWAVGRMSATQSDVSGVRKYVSNVMSDYAALIDLRTPGASMSVFTP